MIKDELLQLKDEKYREFHAKLVPGMKNNLGVRLPELRRIARRIAKEEGLSYLAHASDDSYEEVLLQGLVIGYAKCDVYERLEAIDSFLHKIDNWATCDSFVSTLKFAITYQDIVWKWLMEHIKTTKTYQLRFVVVMILDYYINDKYLKRCFDVFDQIQHEDYYVKMAVAWAISIAYVKYPKETMEYLLDNSLDAWTYNKALQKAIESLRSEKEDKETLRSMKRS